SSQSTLLLSFHSSLPHHHLHSFPTRRSSDLLSADNPEAGLYKMCVDVSKSLFRNLASEGVIFTDGMLKTLRATYLQIAQEAIKRSEEHTSELQSRFDLVCRLLLEKKNLRTMTFLKKILLVDHEPRVTALVSPALESTGRFFVKVEADVRLAQHAAPWFRPDLLLLA